MMSAHLKALSGDPAAIWGLVGPRPRLWRVPCRGARPRQGGHRLLHDGQRPGAQARRRARLPRRAAAGRWWRSRWSAIAALVFNATAPQMNRVADALALGELRRHRGDRRLAGLARRARADRGAARLCRAPRGDRRAARSTPARLGGRRRRRWRRANFRVETPGGDIVDEAECGHAHAPDPRRWATDFPGAARRRRSSRRARGPVRARSWCWCSRSRRASSRPESPRLSRFRWARR